MSDPRARRATFDEVAERYDRARPTYPDELLDDLVAIAGLVPGARVLEVGCGTGTATVPLAERGLAVTCVELGASLAAVAARNLASFPDVEIVVADFESWTPQRSGYDALVSFTAYLFELVAERRYQWDVEYTADEYIDLIGTYSENIALPEETRRELVERLHARIGDARVRKTYLATLDVGVRV